MAITLNPDQEQRIERALRCGAYQNADEVIDRVLEMLDQQNAWLAVNRETVDAKIRRGMEELDRGEGIPEDALDAHLARLKASRNEAPLDLGARSGPRPGPYLEVPEPRERPSHCRPCGIGSSRQIRVSF